MVVARTTHYVRVAQGSEIDSLPRVISAFFDKRRAKRKQQRVKQPLMSGECENEDTTAANQTRLQSIDV
jgi:hypothetical protein